MSELGNKVTSVVKSRCKNLHLHNNTLISIHQSLMDDFQGYMLHNISTELLTNVFHTISPEISFNIDSFVNRLEEIVADMSLLIARLEEKVFVSDIRMNEIERILNGLTNHIS
mmetsp:Transcript_13770/g.12483  ORF Transcript_13770/g.12483 Transcript_13770/m.12483 type:complete len:113 (-) Transcript_13770:51-389(-)